MQEPITIWRIDTRRHDLEFMARMLGVETQQPSSAPFGRGGLPMPEYHIARRIQHAARDPIANARARQRINGLLDDLPIGAFRYPGRTDLLPV